MRKFNCDKYHLDVSYSDCCNCKHYITCTTREVMGSQRMFSAFAVIVCLLLLGTIIFSYIRGIV